MLELSKVVWIVLFAYGALQGCVLAAVLFFSGGKSGGRGWMAALLLVLSVILSAVATRMAGLFQIRPHLIWIDVPIWMLIGPLLYMYIRTITGRQNRFRWTDSLHFLPFAVRLADLGRFYFLPAATKLRFYSSFLMPVGAASFTVTGFIRTHLYFFQMLFYAIACYRLLRQYENRLKESYADSRVERIAWLRTVMAVFVSYAALDLGLSLASVAGFRAPPSVGNAVILLLSGLVHMTGIQAIRRPAALFATSAAPVETSAEGAFTGEEAARLRERLERYMQTERPYLDSELSLSVLAGRLEMPPRLLSQLLNREMGFTFYEFVNHYRVEEAKRRLLDPSCRSLSILGIASEVGFNSKPTFNRVFKKMTGDTPSGFIRSFSQGST